MAKLLKLRRGTTTQHASFTGAEGEVTIDTTKDTAVVHDGSQAGGRPMAREDMSNVSSASIAGQLGTDSIATTKIAAGALPTDVTVTNANVVSSAAIAGTKISPNFGSQNLESTGYFNFGTVGGTDNISKSNFRIENTYPTLFLNDTDTNNDFYIRNANGTFGIHDVQNAADRLTINSSGTVATGGNLDVGAGLDVTGNITVTGTVDGVDVASLNTTVGGNLGTSNIASNAQISLSKLETITSNRIVGNDSGNAVPKELTAAEVRTIINVENGATADQTASEILTAIKTVDGASSGLDADTLDGLHAATFLRGDTNDQASGTITFSGGTGAITLSNNSDIRSSAGNWTGDTNKIQWHASHLYFQSADRYIFRKTDGNEVLYIDGSGNLVADANITAYSDKRLKTDIHTINDALGICGKLRGVSYKWIKNNKPSIGVIAQEIEEVIPEVVLTNVTTDPATQTEVEVKSVDYGKIVGVLINAINELKAELDTHKKTCCGGE